MPASSVCSSQGESRRRESSSPIIWKEHDFDASNPFPEIGFLELSGSSLKKEDFGGFDGSSPSDGKSAFTFQVPPIKFGSSASPVTAGGSSFTFGANASATSSAPTIPSETNIYVWGELWQTETGSDSSAEFEYESPGESTESNSSWGSNSDAWEVDSEEEGVSIGGQVHTEGTLNPTLLPSVFGSLIWGSEPETDSSPEFEYESPEDSDFKPDSHSEFLVDEDEISLLREETNASMMDTIGGVDTPNKYGRYVDYLRDFQLRREQRTVYDSEEHFDGDDESGDASEDETPNIQNENEEDEGNKLDETIVIGCYAPSRNTAKKTERPFSSRADVADPVPEAAPKDPPPKEDQKDIPRQTHKIVVVRLPPSDSTNGESSKANQSQSDADINAARSQGPQRKLFRMPVSNTSNANIYVAPPPVGRNVQVRLPSTEPDDNTLSNSDSTTSTASNEAKEMNTENTNASDKREGLQTKKTVEDDWKIVDELIRNGRPDDEGTSRRPKPKQKDLNISGERSSTGPKELQATPGSSSIGANAEETPAAPEETHENIAIAPAANVLAPPSQRPEELDLNMEPTQQSTLASDEEERQKREQERKERKKAREQRIENAYKDCLRYHTIPKNVVHPEDAVPIAKMGRNNYHVCKVTRGKDTIHRVFLGGEVEAYRYRDTIELFLPPPEPGRKIDAKGVIPRSLVALFDKVTGVAFDDPQNNGLLHSRVLGSTVTYVRVKWKNGDETWETKTGLRELLGSKAKADELIWECVVSMERKFWARNNEEGSDSEEEDEEEEDEERQGSELRSITGFELCDSD